MTDDVLGYVVLQRFPLPRSVHGWRYEPVGAIFPDRVRVSNVYEGRWTRFPESEFLIARLQPQQLLRDRNPRRIYPELPWPSMSEVLAAEHRTPQRPERLEHIINLDTGVTL